MGKPPSSSAPDIAIVRLAHATRVTLAIYAHMFHTDGSEAAAAIDAALRMSRPPRGEGIANPTRHKLPRMCEHWEAIGGQNPVLFYCRPRTKRLIWL